MESLSLTFSPKKKDINANKLAIIWQNFARVRLQLKFKLYKQYFLKRLN